METRCYQVPIDVDEADARKLLTTSPVAKGILGLHIQPTLSLARSSSELRCKTVRIVRPDGLQILFDVQSADGFSAELALLLSRRDITFVTYDGTFAQAALQRQTFGPIPRLYDLRTTLEAIRSVGSTILGRPLRSTDLSEAAGSILGISAFESYLGTSLLADSTLAILCLDIYSLLDYKFVELYETLRADTSQRAQLPTASTWFDPIPLSQVTQTDENTTSCTCWPTTSVTRPVVTVLPMLHQQSTIHPRSRLIPLIPMTPQYALTGETGPRPRESSSSSGQGYPLLMPRRATQLAPRSIPLSRNAWYALPSFSEPRGESVMMTYIIKKKNY